MHDIRRSINAGNVLRVAAGAICLLVSLGGTLAWGQETQTFDTPGTYEFAGATITIEAGESVTITQNADGSLTIVTPPGGGTPSVKLGDATVQVPPGGTATLKTNPVTGATTVVVPTGAPPVVVMVADARATVPGGTTVTVDQQGQVGLIAVNSAPPGTIVTVSRGTSTETVGVGQTAQVVAAGTSQPLPGKANAPIIVLDKASVSPSK